jgi:hypothetical protein
MSDEERFVRIPAGLAEKINEIAVHKLRSHNTVTEFVLEATRRHLESVI